MQHSDWSVHRKNIITLVVEECHDSSYYEKFAKKIGKILIPITCVTFVAQIIAHLIHSTAHNTFYYTSAMIAKL